MKSYLIVLLCTCSILFSCKKEISNTSGTEISAIIPGQNKTEERIGVPFKGTYNTTRELLSPPPVVQVKIIGMGAASHLGKSKFIISSTINFTTPPPFQLHGTSIFYAADGDTFYTTFTGSSTPLPDGTFLAIFNHNITGGTGRFENAGGSFVGHHIGHPVNPEGHTVVEGFIDY